MISLIISESALELVPFELEDHPSVVSHARKLENTPLKFYWIIQKEQVLMQIQR